MGTTASPISIYFSDTSKPNSMENESSLQASSIHAQFALRERYDFQWANDAERNGQTGMAQGSRGYQVNTKTEYLYDANAWRLAVPHSEWTFSTADLWNGVVRPMETLSIDNATSTSTNQATTSTTPRSGQIIIVDPGIYAYSATMGTIGAIAFTGRTFTELSYSSDPANAASIVNRTSIPPGEDRVTISVPNLRTTVPNQPVYLSIYHSNTSPVKMSGRIRLTRLG